MPEKQLAELWQYTWHFVVMLCGAVVHATARLKVARDQNDTNFTWVDFVILLPIAMFSGFVFWLLARVYFDNEIAHFLAASVGSFMGLAGVNKISEAVIEMLTSRLKK